MEAASLEPGFEDLSHVFLFIAELDRSLLNTK